MTTYRTIDGAEVTPGSTVWDKDARPVELAYGEMGRMASEDFFSAEVLALENKVRLADRLLTTIEFEIQEAQSRRERVRSIKETVSRRLAALATEN